MSNTHINNNAGRVKPAVVDLFCGAGGFSLGAARAGFDVRAGIDNDPEALRIHKLNFGETQHLEADISNLSGQAIKDLFGFKNGDLTGIIGGPPCQGFSFIGKNDHRDLRNKLFVHFFRIVAEAKPKFFLAENVPGIMDDKNKRLREKAFRLIEGQYVFLAPLTKAANEYGAPTSRTRVFFFGYLRDEMADSTEEDFEPPTDVEEVFVGDALKGLPIKIKPEWQSEADSWRIARVYGSSYYHARLQGRIPLRVGDRKAIEILKTKLRASGSFGTAHSKDIINRFAAIEPGKRDPVSKSHRLDSFGFCPTIRAGTGPADGRFQAVRPIHPTEDRVITPREAARLQGFPDWFQFSPTKWHSFRQIGSSVSPILAEYILKTISRYIIRGLRYERG